MATMSVELSYSTAKPSFKTAWWTPRLAGPIIVGGVVRLGLLAVALARTGTSSLTQPDTSSYLIPGCNLLLHGSFVADGVPDLFRTPAYPIFLAITSLAGLTAATVANVILSLLTILLVWKLGRAVFSDGRIALGAAWIFAFEPISVIFSISLISETLFIVLFLLSMERMAEFLRGHSLRVLAVAGLWLAAATFVRPITYYLPVALALGLFLVLARVPVLSPQQQTVAWDPGLRWKAPAVLLISFLPWIAAWQIRNWVETGFHGFSSAGEVFYYTYTGPGITAQVEHRLFSDVHKELGHIDFTNQSGQVYLFQAYLDRHPEQAGWNQTQRIAFIHDEAARTIRAHFGIYLRSRFPALFKMLFFPGTGYFDRMMYPINTRQTAGLIDQGPARWWIVLAKSYPRVAAEKAVFSVVLLGLYMFAAWGLFLAARGVFRGALNNACLWLMLGTSLYFLAVSVAMVGPEVEVRYRLPFMPFICIFAAAGFIEGRRRTIHDRERLVPQVA
ncbi:MAG: glycosyltransferase family 39 protein, partial [Terracidiphilus sp.]|nr:glycosyltransferase family 39 protein [Terracidiphilus sp.]